MKKIKTVIENDDLQRAKTMLGKKLLNKKVILVSCDISNQMVDIPTDSEWREFKPTGHSTIKLRIFTKQ